MPPRAGLEFHARHHAPIFHDFPAPDQERGAMTAGGWTDRALSAWVDGARRAAGAIVVAALAGTVLLVLYAVENIRINTDTTDMLSRELPFRQADIAYRQAFPHVSDNLVVLVESANPDLAEDAAARLPPALRAPREPVAPAFLPPA